MCVETFNSIHFQCNGYTDDDDEDNAFGKMSVSITRNRFSSLFINILQYFFSVYSLSYMNRFNQVAFHLYNLVISIYKQRAICSVKNKEYIYFTVYYQVILPHSLAHFYT